VPIGPAPIKEVERINVVVIRNSGRQTGPPRRDFYAMDVDRGRNCYNCGGFRHLTKNCRNRGIGNKIGEGKRLEYGQKNNGQNNLNRDKDLIVFD